MGLLIIYRSLHTCKPANKSKQNWKMILFVPGSRFRKHHFSTAGKTYGVEIEADGQGHGQGLTGCHPVGAGNSIYRVTVKSATTQNVEARWPPTTGFDSCQCCRCCSMTSQMCQRVNTGDSYIFYFGYIRWAFKPNQTRPNQTRDLCITSLSPLYTPGHRFGGGNEKFLIAKSSSQICG